MEKFKQTVMWGVVLAALVLAGLPLAVQAKGKSEGNTITFNAFDYGYKGPDSVKAGVVRLQIKNEGKELHHAQLIQLLEGKTADDLIAGMKANPNSPPPPWVKFLGGPNGAVPGEQTTAVVNLEPGNYALLCIIPDDKGVMHLVHGMVKPFTVTGKKAKKGAEPKADATITVVDFNFVPEKPLKAGKQMIKVVNHGTMPHELLLLQMAPGKKASDFGAFEADRALPPPGKPVGGIVGVQNGMHTYFEADLTPGNYGLICFFPDEKGEPHFKRGMTLDFTVE